MNDFSYHAPDSLSGAHALLAEHGDEARLISGGTGLVNMMKQGLIAIDHLVSLQKVPNLNYIRWTSKGLEVGGFTSQQLMATSDIVSKNLPLLTETYGHVATVRVRNAATVGGGVSHGDPAQDPPPSLLVLDASVTVSSRDGKQRTVRLRDGWFVDYYTTALEAGDIVIGLTVPPVPSGAKTTFTKFLPRTADDYATVSISALGLVNGGVVTDVRLALGAVNTTAVYSQAVPKVLMGQKPTMELIREAAKGVAAEVAPTPDFRGSAEYKSDMAVVFARRALAKVLGVE